MLVSVMGNARAGGEMSKVMQSHRTQEVLHYGGI